MYSTIAPNGAKVIVKNWSVFALRNKNLALAISFNDELFKGNK